VLRQRASRDNSLEAMDRIVSEAGWPIRLAKAYVLHLMPDLGLCHRCGTKLAGDRGPQLCPSCRSLNLHPTGDLVPDSECVLRLDSWTEGMRKVSVTETLKDALRVRLRSAKALTDHILAGESPLFVGPLQCDKASDLAGSLRSCGVAAVVTRDISSSAGAV
jgi:hypothetical protein